MIHRARALVTVLALAAAPSVAYARRRPPPTTTDAFFKQQKYTYCDAKTLAGLWKQSMGDAKARIGMKLQAGGESVKYLDQELGRSREFARKHADARCSLYDAGFQYEDAETLAKMWSTNVDKAKAMIEDKLLVGMEHDLHAMVEHAGRHAKPDTNEDAIGAFLAQDKYTYCDAKMIGAMWKKSVGDGKTYIGQKLKARAPRAIEEQLVKARAEAMKHPDNRCAFYETEFQYDDAVALAKLWKKDVAGAKALVELKVANGQTAYVRKLLHR